MAYVKPTTEQINFALEQGWNLEQAQRGYEIFDFDSTGWLEITRIEDVYADTNVTDEDCAIEAQRTGYCNIIPVTELPEGFERRYYGWVDTPENRKRIEDYSLTRKEYIFKQKKMVALIRDLLPKLGAFEEPSYFYDDHGFRNGEGDILCVSENEAEIISRFLEQLLPDQNISTGYYSPKEVNSNIGYYYISFK